MDRYASRYTVWTIRSNATLVNVALLVTATVTVTAAGTATISVLAVAVFKSLAVEHYIKIGVHVPPESLEARR